MHTPVLLVDANPDGLELYATALALEGIRSATARSADEAIGVLHNTPPRVLVTGLRLPGTGGADLIRHVRQNAPGNIYIVALSTDDDVEEHVARAAGCDVVLRVPCLPETLVGQLRRALS